MPNRVIIGLRLLTFSSIIDDKLNACKLWSAIKVLPNIFWRQYLREYVPSLNVHNLSDLVILKDDHQYRYVLSLTRVVYFNKKNHGLVQCVKVKLPTSTLTKSREHYIFFGKDRVTIVQNYYSSHDGEISFTSRSTLNICYLVEYFVKAIVIFFKKKKVEILYI